MAAALLALGSNLGDRQRILDEAVAQLAVQPNIVVTATSRWHATRPVGGPKGQAEFLNGAVLLGTSLSPEQLHAVLRQIEAAAGRTREGRWAPRTLDLDLLLYDEISIDTPDLMVPHPRMAFRRFVLEPAAEIAPSMRHPTIGWTITELRDHVCARSHYKAAITGLMPDAKRALATAVAAAVSGRVISSHVVLDWKLNSIPRRSLSFERAIELLELAAQPIRMTTWPSGSFKAISDYWFDEVVCYAGLNLPIDRLREYFDRFREQAAWVAEPKLLVLLDTPANALRRWTREGGKLFSPLLELHWLAPQREWLLSQIAKRRHGPVLRLDVTNPSEAEDELVAAIQSMQ